MNITSNDTSHKLPRNGYRANILGYMRVSKDDELTGSHTFETQELRIRERLDRLFGAGNYDLDLHCDDGVSGGLALNPTRLQKRTRKSLRVLADKIATRQYDALIVYSQNRLFRNPRGLIEFTEDELLPSETALISATEELNISTANGRATMNLIAVIDGLYRDNAVQRNKDAAATAKQLGYYIGQVPFGWEWQPKEDVAPGARRGIVPSPEYTRWLMFMKEHYLSGWGGSRIAGELNRLQVPPPSHHERWKKKADQTRDTLWTGSEVVRILCSPTHAGLIKSKGELIHGLHFEHRLWDPEVHEEMIALRKSRVQRFQTVTAKANNEQILSGLIHCARCGRRLYSSGTNKNSKAYRAYVCLNGHQQGQPTCPNLNVRAEWVEQAVVEELERLAATPEMRELLHQEAEKLLKEEGGHRQKEHEQLKQTLAGFSSRLERWMDLYTMGSLDAAEFSQYREKLLADKQAVVTRLAELDSLQSMKQDRHDQAQRVQQSLESLPLAWEHLDYDERRRVLDSLLETLAADRVDRLIRLKVKVLLLPEHVIDIPYHSYRGKNRCTADPITRLTKGQLSILYHLSQGLTQVQAAQRLGLEKDSVFTITKRIRKNCDGRSLPEIIELAKERIEAVLPYLRLEAKPESAEGSGGEGELPYISGPLMEVLPLFAKGASTMDVAKRLDLPTSTVQGRRSKILKIMQTSSMLEAVERLQELGILKV